MDSSIFELGQKCYSKKRSQSKIRNRMVNSLDLDKMTHYEPSHLDLQFAQVSVLVYRADKS